MGCPDQRVRLELFDILLIVHLLPTVQVVVGLLELFKIARAFLLSQVSRVRLREL